MNLKLNHPETDVRHTNAEDFLELLKEWEKLCKTYVLGDPNGMLETSSGKWLLVLCVSSSDSEVEGDALELYEESITDNASIAIACDDGCVRLYNISESDQFNYHKSLPRVSGCVVNVTWSPDAKMIYSGSSDGFIRCWNAKSSHEVYRITVGLGGLGGGSDLCVWSLLALRCGTLASADSSGSVQFWDSLHGTLLQAHSCHKGDVNALAASPSHTWVFSAGSDGQIILYKLSGNATGSADDRSCSKPVKNGYILVM